MSLINEALKKAQKERAATPATPASVPPVLAEGAKAPASTPPPPPAPGAAAAAPGAPVVAKSKDVPGKVIMLAGGLGMVAVVVIGLVLAVVLGGKEPEPKKPATAQAAKPEEAPVAQESTAPAEVSVPLDINSIPVVAETPAPAVPPPAPVPAAAVPKREVAASPAVVPAPAVASAQPSAPVAPAPAPSLVEVKPATQPAPAVQPGTVPPPAPAVAATPAVTPAPAPVPQPEVAKPATVAAGGVAVAPAGGLQGYTQNLTSSVKQAKAVTATANARAGEATAVMDSAAPVAPAPVAPVASAPVAPPAPVPPVMPAAIEIPTQPQAVPPQMAGAQAGTAAAPADTNAARQQQVLAFLDSLRLSGVRKAGSQSRILFNNQIFRLNEVVHPETGLRVVEVQGREIIFADDSGVRYRKRF